MARLLNPSVKSGAYPGVEKSLEVLETLAEKLNDEQLDRANLDLLARKIVHSEATADDLLNQVRDVTTAIKIPGNIDQLMLMELRVAQMYEYVQAIDRSALLNEDEMLTLYQVVALTEILRVLNSSEKFDAKEKKDMISNFITLNTDGIPFNDKLFGVTIREGVQIALKPIRPMLVRDFLEPFFIDRFEEMKKTLVNIVDGIDRFYLYKGGSTTINGKMIGIDKAVPIRQAVDSKDVQAEYTIFSGDDMKGVDAAAARLAQQKGYEGLMVAYSGETPLDRKVFPNVIEMKTNPLTKGLVGPDANLKVYQHIVGLLDKAIEQLFRGPEGYTPAPVMAQLREDLGLRDSQRQGPDDNITVDDRDQEEQKEISGGELVDRVMADESPTDVLAKAWRRRG